MSVLMFLNNDDDTNWPSDEAIERYRNRNVGDGRAVKVFDYQTGPQSIVDAVDREFRLSGHHGHGVRLVLIGYRDPALARLLYRERGFPVNVVFSSVEITDSSEWCDSFWSDDGITMAGWNSSAGVDDNDDDLDIISHVLRFINDLCYDYWRYARGLRDIPSAAAADVDSVRDGVYASIMDTFGEGVQAVEPVLDAILEQLCGAVCAEPAVTDDGRWTLASGVVEEGDRAAEDAARLVVSRFDCSAAAAVDYTQRTTRVATSFASTFWHVHAEIPPTHTDRTLAACLIENLRAVADPELAELSAEQFSMCLNAKFIATRRWRRTVGGASSVAGSAATVGPSLFRPEIRQRCERFLAVNHLLDLMATGDNINDDEAAAGKRFIVRSHLEHLEPHVLPQRLVDYASTHFGYEVRYFELTDTLVFRFTDDERGRFIEQSHAHRFAGPRNFKEFHNEAFRTIDFKRVWDQCNVIQDYLTVYDGSLATDPVLVRLCGGDAVPDIVSSGPNMLLEFHTSAFDNPFHPVPLSYLPGFELDVEILFVDNKSPSYAKNTSQCEFFIKPFNNTNWGLLDSPRHSLPPNTSCKYHFQGSSHQTVWLSFIKYHAASTDPNAYHLSNECNARLRIWDKVVSTQTKKPEAVLMGEFCKEQDLPRLCDHALLGNDTRHVRPCAAKESYTSSADELTVEIYLKQGSVLFPLQFLLRYEFVDQSAERRQGPGDVGPAACSRTFATGSGYFGSPKNVFFYGRGGRRNLTCVFRFVPGSTEERVRVTVSRIHSASTACVTETDARTDRSRCVYGGGSGVDADSDGVGGSRDDGTHARVTITHYPWPDIELPVGCACSELRHPFTFESYPGAAVRVEFAVRDMNVTQDHRDFGFSAEYAFVKASLVDRNACRDARKHRHLRGPGGFIDLIGEPSAGGRRPATGACTDFPWLIGPATADSSMLRTGGFVYMKLRGYEIQRWRTNSFMCPTRNRVVVYTGAGDGPKTARVICPYDTGASYNALRGSYEAFSPGWAEPLTGAQQLQPNSKTVAVEFLNREYGAYAVTWMEVSKMPRIMPSTNVYAMSSNVHPECAYRCPELNACISSQFWCDGETHCPMGFDEDPANCASRNSMNLMYVGVLGGTAVVLFTVTVVAAVVCLRCKANRSRRAEDGRRRASQKGSAAIDPMMCAVDRTHYDKRFLEQNGGGGGVVGNSLGKRYPSSSDDLYLECKQDSMC